MDLGVIQGPPRRVRGARGAYYTTYDYYLLLPPANTTCPHYLPPLLAATTCCYYLLAASGVREEAYRTAADILQKIIERPALLGSD